MKKYAAPLIAALLAAVVAIAVVGRPEQADAKPDANPGARDAIVHLFEWPWASVASECTNVLGPKGFGGVQVSPPQEHVVLPSAGYPWWQDYQPVSYQLVTRRGDRAAFANMVSTCHAAGVKIYVDAVINHMAGGASTGTGSAGTSYSHYSYPAVPFGNDDFHHCGRNGNDDIANWGDRWEIQNCELVDLSDLKTESSYVRGKLVAYLNDLISLGVDGFRVDAAKHMPVADLQAIYGQLNGNPYFFQETIEGGAGEPSPTEYTGIGDVTEFRYGDVVGNAFRDGNLQNLQNLPSQMLLSSGDAVAFIDNHDTQRNGRAKLTYKDGTNYALAEAFMLAYPYGTPAVMSSFTFSNPEAGPPATSNGTTTAVNCSSGWACEHRWRTTANLVGFHNAAAGTGLTNWWSNGGNQIGFGRGSNAYAVFNRGGSLNRTFSTSLPAGTYCDVANGDFANGACTGTAYTVNASGQFTATVPANGMLALHINARGTGTGPTTPPPTGCTTVAVTFAANATTVWGENVFVLGNRAELSNWNTSGGVALSSATYPVWRGTVNLPANTAVEYKYVKKNGSSVAWESGGNRTLNTGSACTLTVNDSWRS
ncbi:alpha-amylase family glycosyl hydrolase [Actinoplanes sp. TRM 88003]|uniref:Alpha-amylase n=1 Tax=Paractinoplanes aksuensis TaxID=2939490 RepID=A0ABT1DU08_9ACTN|nr:carbohydrate-binding module family 20 domain-containing protein [Actinoplanes aksuensis]MCO8274312.1 alpha-amylase family glycosyl hydrolase [Actinoplanes aksuensis]